MMKGKNYLIFGIVIVLGIVLGVILIGGYIKQKFKENENYLVKEQRNNSSYAEQEFKENPTIEEIISRPDLYNGKTVVINGKFGGWSGNLACDYKNMAMKTRSDTIIYDATGCLYMSGEVEVLYKENELNPWHTDNIGSNLKIRAVVNLLDGKPILVGK